jgi:hypothetical protein
MPDMFQGAPRWAGSAMMRDLGASGKVKKLL